ERDMQKITAIMKSVAGIQSPTAAISWALDNISIPSGSAPRPMSWTPLPSSQHPYVPLTPGKHKLAIFKINAAGLAQLDSDVIVGADALEKISLAPTHCAFVSKATGLSK